MTCARWLSGLPFVVALTATALADSSTPQSFSIEVRFKNPSATPISVPVSCTVGCEWASSTIECAPAPSECAAVLTNGAGPGTSEPHTGAAQVERTGMLGLGIATRNGDVVVTDVVAGSPASTAGFRRGDLVRSFNSKPVKNHRELFDAVSVSKPGDHFEALVEREMAILALSGILAEGPPLRRQQAGSRSGTSQLASEPHTLAAFEIEFASPSGAAEFTCSKGCAWERLSITCDRRGGSCLVAIDQHGSAG